jgi:hypothetical protein
MKKIEIDKLELVKLNSSEMNEINGGGWAYDAGYWLAEAISSFVRGVEQGHHETIK